jgi:predicted nucleic acid-binding protein
LDTSFLIDLQHELGGRRSRGASRFLTAHSEATPHISLVSWMEFAEGYAEEQEAACRLFLSRFPVIAPDQSIAWRASRISRRLRQSGTLVGDHDLWIAATALDRGMAVVTRNPSHFERIPGLEVLGY